MSRTVDIQQLLKLSAEKRLELISILWNSLDEENADIPVSEEILDEADRRLEDLKRHPERAVPYEEMRKRRGWR